MKSIYIFLTRTGTKVADIIGMITGDKYAHASISLTRDLTELYSFARRGIHNPLHSGFEKEDIHRGIFAIFSDCQCGLYELQVPDHVYEKMRQTLIAMYHRKYDFRYNFIGLFSCAFGIPHNPQNRYTCSQFVSWILEFCGAAELPKDRGLMKPDDLAMLPELKLIYEGRIGNADRSDAASDIPLSLGFFSRKA